MGRQAGRGTLRLVAGGPCFRRASRAPAHAHLRLWAPAACSWLTVRSGRARACQGHGQELELDAQACPRVPRRSPEARGRRDRLGKGAVHLDAGAVSREMAVSQEIEQLGGRCRQSAYPMAAAAVAACRGWRAQRPLVGSPGARFQDVGDCESGNANVDRLSHHVNDALLVTAGGSAQHELARAGESRERPLVYARPAHLALSRVVSAQQLGRAHDLAAEDFCQCHGHGYLSSRPLGASRPERC